MLLFVDLECDGESVKNLGDAAKVLANVVEQAKNLARNGMDRENIVEPILNDSGDKVGEWEWVVDKKKSQEDLLAKLGLNPKDFDFLLNQE